MDAENYLEKLRQEYIRLKPDQYFIDYGWVELLSKIENFSMDDDCKYHRYFRTVFASFATLILFISLLSIAKLARAALPGEPLYKVKRITEDIITKVSGKKQIIVENRANEIIDVAKKEEINQQILKQSVEEYKQSVIEAKEEVKDSKEESKRFQQKLQEQKKEFQQLLEKKSDIKEELEEAIEVTKEVKEQNDNRKNEFKKENLKKHNPKERLNDLENNKDKD